MSLLGQQRVIKHTRVLLTVDTLVGKLLLKSNRVIFLAPSNLLATGTYNPLPFFIVTVSLVTGTSWVLNVGSEVPVVTGYYRKYLSSYTAELSLRHLEDQEELLLYRT